MSKLKNIFLGTCAAILLAAAAYGQLTTPGGTVIDDNVTVDSADVLRHPSQTVFFDKNLQPFTTGATLATPIAGDFFLFSDTSACGGLRKADAADFIGTDGVYGGSGTSPCGTTLSTTGDFRIQGLSNCGNIEIFTKFTGGGRVDLSGHDITLVSYQSSEIQIFAGTGSGNGPLDIRSSNFDVNVTTGNLTVTGTIQGIALTTAGVATNYLDETGSYSVPVGSTNLYTGDGALTSARTVTMGANDLTFGAASGTCTDFIVDLSGSTIGKIILTAGNGDAMTIGASFSLLTCTDITLTSTTGDITVNPGGDFIITACNITANSAGEVKITQSLGIGIDPVAGTRLILPQENDVVTPTLAFGDGDSGISESGDDTILISTAGTGRFWVDINGIRSVDASGPAIAYLPTSSVIPSLAPSRSDTNTGIGRAGTDQLSLIAGGVEQVRLNVTGNHIVNSLLDVATGNEVALSLNYTVNKATSGNDTGLVINQTDTLSPGTSLLLDLQQGGTSRFSVEANDGRTVIGTAVPGTLTKTFNVVEPSADIYLESTGANDTKYYAAITDTSDRSWAWGIDFSESDQFSIAFNTALTTSLTSDARLTISKTGDVDVPLGTVTASNLKTHALIEDRAPSASTTSATFVTLLSSASTTFSGRPVLISLHTSLFGTGGSTSSSVEFAIQIDSGSDDQIARFPVNNVDINHSLTGALIITPTAGSHIIRLRWRRPAGDRTLTMDSNNQILVHGIEL